MREERRGGEGGGGGEKRRGGQREGEGRGGEGREEDRRGKDGREGERRGAEQLTNDHVLCQDVCACVHAALTSQVFGFPFPSLLCNLLLQNV